MATIVRFEDLVCWQRAREMTKAIYQTFKDCRDYGFKDQIQRAAVSVMSNIAEGFERGTSQEFLNYLFIAKGSAGEVRCQLYVALDAGFLKMETFNDLKMLIEECSRLLQSFIVKVKTGANRGLQYKHIPKEDTWSKEILRQNNPEMYQKFYGGN